MNYSQNNPTNSEQDTIRIRDVARWLAKIAATDGVVSVGERKLLNEFANEFNLDANTLYRMAHGYANSVAVPEVEAVSRSEMIGSLFEKSVVTLFSDKSRFKLLAWRSDKIVDGTYAAENLMPDLHLRHRLDDGEVEYFVECKYRSSLSNDTLDLSAQLGRYRRMSSSSELFIAIGIGGTPSNPEKFYIIPSRMIKHDSVLHLENFEKCLCSKDPESFHRYINHHYSKRVFPQPGEANKTLAQYKYYFSHLNANKQQGKTAPHKNIMLLSVIKLIATKRVVSNRIEFTEELQRCFLSTWKQYVGESSIFKPAVGTPFWHLNSEPFWKLVPFCGGDDTITKLQKGRPYSVKAICENIRYAQIDQELFLLLQNETERNILRQILINGII